VPRPLGIGLLVLALVGGCSSSSSGPEDYANDVNAACREALEHRRAMIRYTRRTGAGSEGTVDRDVALRFIGMGRELLDGLREALSDLTPPRRSRAVHERLRLAVNQQSQMLDVVEGRTEGDPEMVDTRFLAQWYEVVTPEDEAQMAAHGLGDCGRLYGPVQNIAP
jgi:hypothetical protein